MMKRWILFCGLLFAATHIVAQSRVEQLGKRIVKRAGEQVENRVEQRAAEGVEKGMDKTEDAVKGNAQNSKSDSENSTSTKSKPQQDLKASNQQNDVELQAYSQYDFIPGDKVLLYEDFSQDAVGDFPALWTTNGSGEIKTINIAEGKWLYMSTIDKQYQLMKELNLPDTYIVEFDAIIPANDDNPNSVRFALFNSENADLGYVEASPTTLGFSLEIVPSKNNGSNGRWLARTYSNSASDWLSGESSISPIKENALEHIIIWVQKRRVRVYHSGQKVLDLPTVIEQGFKPTRLSFDIWDLHSTPYVSNLRITTAAPDTRSKLLNEGKLISYGIYFDVNSDKVKSESYGALKSIAEVIKSAGGVKVQILGHTDNAGDDAKNLDLSKRRALAVKNELVKTFGVDAASLSTDGAGESKPIAPNDTPSNMALNRRVEFVKM